MGLFVAFIPYGVVYNESVSLFKKKIGWFFKLFFLFAHFAFFLVSSINEKHTFTILYYVKVKAFCEKNKSHLLGTGARRRVTNIYKTLKDNQKLSAAKFREFLSLIITLIHTSFRQGTKL